MNLSVNESVLHSLGQTVLLLIGRMYFWLLWYNVVGCSKQTRSKWSLPLYFIHVRPLVRHAVQWWVVLGFRTNDMDQVSTSNNGVFPDVVRFWFIGLFYGFFNTLDVAEISLLAFFVDSNDFASATTPAITFDDPSGFKCVVVLCYQLIWVQTCHNVLCP